MELEGERQRHLSAEQLLCDDGRQKHPAILGWSDRHCCLFASVTRTVDASVDVNTDKHVGKIQT
jgi:hypothetical protein